MPIVPIYNIWLGRLDRIFPHQCISKLTINLNIMKIYQKQRQNNCLIEINQTYSEYNNSYTFGCRVGMRIFSFIFPSILKISLRKY